MAEQLTLFGAFERPDSTKVCKGCLLPFPLSAFTKDRTMKDGLRAKCRACRNIENNEWQRKNPEKVAAKKRRHYHEAGGGEKARAYGRTYGQMNKEKRDANNRRWYEKNRSAALEYAQYYIAENRDNVNARRRRKYAIDPSVATAQRHRRRARKKAADGSHSADDLRRLMKAQRGRCYWCSEHVHDKGTVDHVIPLARGGSDDPSNLVISCRSCNSRKRTRLAYTEWTPPNPLRPEAQAKAVGTV